MVVKICKIHGPLIKSQCNNNQGRLRCKECQRRSAKKHFEAYKQKNLEQRKSYREKNKEKVARIKYESWLANKDKYAPRRREREKIYFRAQSENLSDGYVKHCIQKRSKLKYQDICDELVELKRISLQIRRKVKTIGLEKKNVNKNTKHIRP